MLIILVIMYLSLFALLYTWCIYPALILFMASGVKKKQIDVMNSVLPTVSVIVAAYNEERVISNRIKNLLSLDYPPNKLEIIVASDGSSDGTINAASRFPNVRILDFPFSSSGNVGSSIPSRTKPCLKQVLKSRLTGRWK